jgi:hypothetical protein
MATINLGAIKFNWRGAYNNATAYAVDDVVSSGGSSYICILASTGNAVSNGTYWELMAQKGTDTSVLTTQGDVLYHDGSSLARLAAGTSGQALLTGGTGANPSWGDVSVSMASAYASTSVDQTVASASLVDLTNITATITPSSTSSKILIVGRIQANAASTGMGWAIIRGSTNILESDSPNEVFDFSYEVNPIIHIDSPNTTSATTYKFQVKTYTGDTVDFNAGGLSNIGLVEIKG